MLVQEMENTNCLSMYSPELSAMSIISQPRACSPNGGAVLLLKTVLRIHLLPPRAVQQNFAGDRATPEVSRVLSAPNRSTTFPQAKAIQFCGIDSCDLRFGNIDSSEEAHSL